VEEDFSIAIWPINIPAAIHPRVPNTRIHGNCFPGSVIWEKATLLDNAIVGIYKSE
jgi:hypothetical protein